MTRSQAHQPDAQTVYDRRCGHILAVVVDDRPGLTPSWVDHRLMAKRYVYHELPDRIRHCRIRTAQPGDRELLATRPDCLYCGPAPAKAHPPGEPDTV